MVPVRGIGIGLRMPLAAEMLEQLPSAVRWLEVHPENYVERGGRYPATLDACRRHWPVVTHGLTMGFGSTAPVTKTRMATLCAFLDQVEAPWHSDHLALAGAEGMFVHDLLPVPWNRESLGVATARVREMADALKRPILVENLTYYATFDDSDRSEIQFITDLLDRTGAGLLLDVNNVYVNARNHGFDAEEWISQVPAERVVQIHVAGHLVRPDGLRIDTHAEEICADVYQLLERALQRVGHAPVLLERDGNFSKLGPLMREVQELDELYRRVLGAR
ncbi:MAG: DUF692 domain-containing protein [Sandaracinaceae bacterium]|nr:DUF692 domain-containing protein [Sandaracinaceae bacterium]